MAFKDTFGVEYSDDRQTLLKCPTSLRGSYMVSPMVKTIKERAFENCAELTCVFLPEGLEFVKQYAFHGCNGLTSIKAPISVKKIEKGAFCDCKRIENVMLEGSGINVERDAFEGCNNIKGVSISGEFNVSTCFDSAKLNEISILEGTQIISRPMLMRCDSLKTLYIPSSVNHIEEDAFVDCVNLCNIIINPSNQYFFVHEGALYNRQFTELFFISRKLTGCFTIPDSITHVHPCSIQNCNLLNSVVVTEKVECVGEDIFDPFCSCESLSNIIVKGNTHYSSIDGVLYDNTKIVLIRCPQGKVGELTIPDGVKEIRKNAFKSCSRLSSISIANSVEKIGRRAFDGCEGLNHMHLPKSIIEIGDYAFPDSLCQISVANGGNFVSYGSILVNKAKSSINYVCKNIVGHVNVPEGIKLIEIAAFADCENLVTVTFPNSLKEIQRSAFLHCHSLVDIHFNTGVENIGMFAFGDCKSLKSVTIPKDIHGIWGFSGETLESIALSDGAETIGKNMFKGCIKVTDITIPASVKAVEANAFDDCKALKNIHYEGSLNEWLAMKWLCVEKNGYNLYIQGELLTNVVLDGSVADIRDNAFYYCNSLQHIEIREGVEKIGDSAFNKTSIIGDVYLPDSVKFIGKYAFLSCKKLRSVSIPHISWGICDGVFRYCDALEKVDIRGRNNDGWDEFFSIDGVVFNKSHIHFDGTTEDGGHWFKNVWSVTLYHYPCSKKATKYIVPNEVGSIGDYAFTGVQNLTLVFSDYVPICANTFLNTKVKIQVPIGMKQKFVDGNYPKDAIEEVWIPEVVAESDLPKKCLNVVANNPFRVLGICTNATAKEVSANKTKITRFADVGKTVVFPLDLNGQIGQCVRDKATIEKASASLSLPQEKIKYALFWFVKEDPIDEMALEHVQVGNIEKAIELFGKRENWSALINQGVLWFAIGKIVDAVCCIMKVIHNETYRRALFLATCGEAFFMDETELSRLFVNMLKSEISEKALLSILFEGGFIDDVDCLKEDIVGSIQTKINGEIDKTSQTNPDDAKASYQAGVTLMNNTKQALEELKRILGESDMQYQSLANNVAKRILQFSINYHNSSGKTVDYDKALSLAEYSKIIAKSKLIKERCDENIRIMRNNSVQTKIKNNGVKQDVWSDFSYFYREKTLWEKITDSFLFWIICFILGLGIVAGIIELIADGEFLRGFWIGCGFGSFLLFCGIFGRKR